MRNSETELQGKLFEYMRPRYPNGKRIRLHRLARIADGWETEVYSFRMEYEVDGKLLSDDLILRVYQGNGANGKATREFKAMAKLHEIGFPVPRVHLLETGDLMFGQPFVIMEKVNGRSMGEILETSSENARENMLGLFCKMFVDLHRLDIAPFTSDPGVIPDFSTCEVKNPYGYLVRLFANFRRAIAHLESDEPAFTLFNQVMEWLEKRKNTVPSKRLSVVHLDYHPYNILIQDDGNPSIIDWTNLDVTDYRVDLAWTLLLASTYGSPNMRDCILETYEKVAGRKTENIEYFDVIAATRRLGSIYISLSKGADQLGMKPETTEIIRKQTTHIRAVAKVLSDRTGITIEELMSL